MHFNTAYSSHLEADAIASELMANMDREFADVAPKALVLFAASRIDHGRLLGRLAGHWPETCIVGASSAGEFASQRFGQGNATLMAFGGDDVEVSAAIRHGLASDVGEVARGIASEFSRTSDDLRPYRAALVMADALSGRMDELVHDLTIATGGEHKFFGGGAGDNAAFVKTVVFCGTEVASDAAVALEIRSCRPIGIGACHGWAPASEALRVTEADGARIVSLDGLPAVVAFEDFAEATGQTFDRAAPIPFFLSNILGISTGGQHRLRVPLIVHQDGSISCAAQIPNGALVSIMRSTEGNTVEAARQATEAAMADLGQVSVAGAMMFDCVATRLRLSEAARSEIDAVQSLLPGVRLAGCHTHGQVVRGLGQFAAFQNCTAVVCLLPN